MKKQCKYCNRIIKGKQPIKELICPNCRSKLKTVRELISVLQLIKGKEDSKPKDIVFCKDCKYIMFSDMYGECGRGCLGVVTPYDYCSRGKRR